jgi:hypothetical protein
MWTFAVRPVDHDGWIGSWSPGIGDPTVVGWLTTVLYFVTCAACWSIVRRRTTTLARGEKVLWWVLTGTLLALGINKQLDLQTAFTELGRMMARRQGWYEQRGALQRVFIEELAVLVVIASLLLVRLTRRMPVPSRLAMVGAVVLFGFVLVRAASFHHVDIFLGSRFLGLKANWILELGGISLILAAAIWRMRFGSAGLKNARRN